jgi:hypothetical protein
MEQPEVFQTPDGTALVNDAVRVSCLLEDIAGAWKAQCTTSQEEELWRDGRPLAMQID